MIQKTRILYVSPEMEAYAAGVAEMLCESPGQGSNEDLTFENWDI